MGARALLSQSFVRLAILLGWALVLWGALQLAAAVAESFSEGSAAFARLVPARGATAWGWLGALCVVLALGVLVLGGASLVSRRPNRDANGR